MLADQANSGPDELVHPESSEDRDKFQTKKPNRIRTLKQWPLSLIQPWRLACSFSPGCKLFTFGDLNLLLCFIEFCKDLGDGASDDVWRKESLGRGTIFLKFISEHMSWSGKLKKEKPSVALQSSVASSVFLEFFPRKHLRGGLCVISSILCFLTWFSLSFLSFLPPSLPPSSLSFSFRNGGEKGKIKGLEQ